MAQQQNKNDKGKNLKVDQESEEFTDRINPRNSCQDTASKNF